MIARPVVKNKFWIVEEQGEKVATIQQHTDGIAWVENAQRQQFASVDLLKNHYNIHFDRQSPRNNKVSSNEIYGYPTDVRPYNSVWDIKHRVPLYTQTKKSKCYYAAGYYLMEGKIVFCPKYIFINRVSFLGPFKSEQEAENGKVTHPKSK